MVKKVRRAKRSKVMRWKPEEHVIDQGVTVAVGNATGVAGTGSWATNDYLLNGGAVIAQGTNIYNRLANKIFITKLRVNLAFSINAGYSFRVIVGKCTDPVAAQQTTNALLTAYLEQASPNVLFELVQNGTAPPADMKLYDPAKNARILYDKRFHGKEPGAQKYYGNIKFTKKLDLARSYDITNKIQTGSWFLYIVSSDTVANAALNVTGTVMMNFVDA